MNLQWEKEVGFALKAVVEGGRTTLDWLGRLSAETKGSIRDIVTPVDRTVERLIRDVLAESDYAVLGEEFDGASRFPLSEDAPVWVVDPIDGTVNYFHGLPTYCVSVGLCLRDAFLLGAVCMPKTEELFCTISEDSVILNGKLLSHAPRPAAGSLVGASFSSLANSSGDRRRQYEAFGEINDRTRGCLRTGSAAANICYAAAGRLQAAYGLQAPIWDVAGALAVARAAGCDMRVSPSVNGAVDYVVGSADAVELIHDVCRRMGLLGEICQN